MIKSNKEIKGFTITSINYLEDGIQKVLIIIETTLFHRGIKNDNGPKKSNLSMAYIPFLIVSLIMADSGKENTTKQKEQKMSQAPLKGTIRQQKVNRPNYLFASISSYIFKNDLHTHHTHTHTNTQEFIKYNFVMPAKHVATISLCKLCNIFLLV